MKMRMNERTLDIVRAETYPTKDIPSCKMVLDTVVCMGYVVEIDNQLSDGVVHLGSININLMDQCSIFNGLQILTSKHHNIDGYGLTIQQLGRCLRNNPNRATGRTFRTLCKVMETASASKPGNVTFLIVGNGENNAVWCYSALNRLIHSYHGDSAKYEPQYRRIVLSQSRVIRVLTVEQASNPEHFRGRQSTIIHDHTCIK